MLEKIDLWLVSRVFQPIVELTQRQPRELGSFCAVILLAGQLHHATAAGWDAMRCLVALALLSMLLSSFCAAIYALFGSIPFPRYVEMISFALWVIYAIPMLLLSGEMDWFLVISHAASAGFWFFAACHPPKPRPPARRAVLRAA